MSDNRGGLAGGLSGGLKLAAVALLVHQLMKHAQAEQPTGQPAPGTPQSGSAGQGPWGQQTGGQDAASPGGGMQGGGLGSILGGLFGGGGMAGGGLGGLLGGLGGLLAGARQHGLTSQVDSWVNHGPNQPASAQQLEPMFDPGAVEAAARHAGTDRGTLLDAVAQVMPGLVDRLTPQGRVPQHGEAVDPGLAGELRGMLGGAGGPERGA